MPTYENPRGFSIRFVFAKFVAETRNEIIHKTVVHNLKNIEMKKNKSIGIIIISIGVLVLFYKDSGFYGWGGYIDKSWENIIISLILIITGILFIKRKKTTN